MKQLTMTKVLTPLAALAFAFGVQAAAVSTDGFETETSTVVTNRTGWSFTYGTDGADDASAITAYNNNAPSGENIFPDGTTAGSNYLKLSTEDGMLLRKMNLAEQTGAESLNAGLYVDTDVQFTITDPSDRPEVTGDDKFIIWLEDQGSQTNLCVWARQFTAADGSTFASNVYTLAALNNDPVSIVPGTWHRLTVKALSSVGSGFTFPAFQVYLDGALLKAKPVAGQYITTTDVDDFDNATGGTGIVTGQTYFPAMASTLSALSQIGFSGEGAIDNVVVTHEVPGFTNPATLTFTWDSDAITSVTLTDLGLIVTNSGDSVRVETSDPPTPLAVVIAGTNLGNYNLTIDNAPIANPAAVSISPSSTHEYQISATAKDTVDVVFSLGDNWGEYAATITAVSLGDADISEAVLNATPIALKLGTNVTVRVVTTEGTAAITLGTSSANLTISGTSVTVNDYGSDSAVSIARATSVATVDGEPFGTFEAALVFAKNAGAAKTITLAGNSTLAEAAAIADGNDITIDLAGNDITGAADAAVFTVAAGGTLTITNSAGQIGHVITNGAAAACISNAGTLNLQAGKFNGPITGGANVTGGNYTETIAGAVTPAGYVLGSLAAIDEYTYGLVEDSWTVRLGAAVDGAYTIDDANDLLALQGGVFAGLATSGVTFKQTANIDMTGVTGFYGIGWFKPSLAASEQTAAHLPAGIAGDADISFAGTYDGNGKTISNVTVESHGYAGIFNCISSATIKNLTVNNANINGTTEDIGFGIVGNAYYNSVISNLTSSGTWPSGMNHNAAGIAVRVQHNTIIVDCTNNVSISTSGKRLGGILSFSEDAASASDVGVQIINCVNNGNLSSSNGERGVAGILARPEAGSGKTTIKGCANFGTLTATGAKGITAQLVGQLTETYTDAGGNTFLASDKIVGDYNGKTVADLAYAVDAGIDGQNYLTTVKPADLAAGGTYVLLVGGLTPTFEFTAAGTIAFDEARTNATAWTGITVASGSGLTLTDSTSGTVKTFTAAASAAADWVADSSSIPANTTAGTQYSQLAGTALADADAKQLTDWAKGKSVAFADVVAAPATYIEAFLLNCEPVAATVAAEKEAFKANITVGADGTVSVTTPIGKLYNGNLQLKGKAALTDATWTDLDVPSSSYKFYKYTLSL